MKRIVNNGEPLNSDFLARWAYLYKYDERGRAIAKKVPGKDWEYTVYDRWDRPVASQDGRQRQQGKWAFVKYDELNRTIITGQISSSRSRQQLTDDVESAVAAGTIGRYETKADNATGSVRIGYTLNKSWPASATGNDLLQISYFDDYAFLNGAQARLQYQQEAASDLTSPGSPSTLTVGLPTISQTRILGSANWLTAATYYDDKARVIQSKSENQLGGVERFTTEYDYAGKVLETYLAHNVTTSGPAHTIRYRYTYYDNDAPKELFAWFNRGAGTAEQLLSKKEYNELGQLVDDKLGVNPANGKYLQSVDYRYNIQGWLTHLNNRNLADGVWLDGSEPNTDPDAEPDLFGMELKYDRDLHTGSTTARYNGNIAESLWHSRRDDKLRGYGYQYDNANRLTAARYSTYDYVNGSYGWNGEKDDAAGLGRFTTSGIAYDLNGNLTQMDRVGHKTTVGNQAQFGAIDQLRYSYDGNRLRTVVDQAGRSDAPNDFEDGTASGDDYGYDANGNMTSDANKGLSVSYNELDLPSQVTFGSGERIVFTYSATGEKLRQDHYTSTRNWSVTYVGGFVYGQGPLLTVATPVGRALYGSTPDNGTRRWLAEYHIRDQLGNLRLAFRQEGATLQRLRATLEQVNAQDEEQHYDNLVATRQLDASHARTGSYAARLNAGQRQRLFGPRTSVALSAGDSVRFEVYGRYEVPKSARRGPVLLPVAAAANAPAMGELAEGQVTPRRGLFPKLAAGLTLAWTAVPHWFQRQRPVPKASVQYAFYNQDSVLVASQVKYLDPEAADAWQQLVVGFTARQAGYVVVSVQNASAQDVWFDDAELRTTQELAVQENHYDPWGQNLVDLEVAGTPNEPRQYSDKERIAESGLEWVDHGARYYDPQLGRWHSPDPADQFASPYSGMANNPVRYTDPDGQFIFIPILIGAAIGATIGGFYGGVTAASNGHSFGGGVWRGALVGAVAGALATIGVGSTFAANLALGVGEGALTGGLDAALYKKDIGQGALYGGLAGGVFATATSPQLRNAFKGQGFRSNDKVLADFVAAGQQQEALDFFKVEGKFDPSNKLFIGNDGANAVTDPGTGEMFFREGAFNGNFDKFSLIADHEAFHSSRILSGKTEYVQNNIDIANEEWLTHMHNYTNQGLYPKHGQDILSKINSYGMGSGRYGITITSSGGTSKTLFREPWWNFIYRIPRRF